MSKTNAVRVITACVVALASARPVPSAEIEIGLADGNTIRDHFDGTFGFTFGLWVSTWGTDDRMVLEFDIGDIPSNPTSITFSTALNNVAGNGDSDIDILDFYWYAGDGTITLDEFFAGGWFWSEEYSEDEPPYMIFIDVTNQVMELVDNGENYLGLRVSTESSATWAFGESMGIGWPVPTLTVEFDGYGLMDLVSFNACLGGPENPASESCEATFDFDNDGDVDLRDYAVFQQRFDG